MTPRRRPPAFLAALAFAQRITEPATMGPKEDARDGSSVYPTPIQEVFGPIRQQLCQFHVIVELTKAVLKAGAGPPAAAHRQLSTPAPDTGQVVLAQSGEGVDLSGRFVAAGRFQCSGAFQPPLPHARDGKP